MFPKIPETLNAAAVSSSRPIDRLPLVAVVADETATIDQQHRRKVSGSVLVMVAIDASIGLVQRTKVAAGEPKPCGTEGGGFENERTALVPVQPKFCDGRGKKDVSGIPLAAFPPWALEQCRGGGQKTTRCLVPPSEGSKTPAKWEF